MKILILQHEDSTKPGTVIEWAEKHHYTYQIHFFSQGNLDSEIDYDLLVICGGGMNVDQEEIHPWLIEEKKFIKAAIAKNKKIAGLCLGSQLLAEVMGGKVQKAPHWEVGWQKVNLIEEKKDFMIFQWHGYQFITPPGAVRTSENESSHHQGFRVGNQIIAYQFHPESTEEWVRECAIDPDLPPKDKWVQSGEEIIAGLKYQTPMREWFFKQLDTLIGQ